MGSLGNNSEATHSQVETGTGGPSILRKDSYPYETIVIVFDIVPRPCFL